MKIKTHSMMSSYSLRYSLLCAMLFTAACSTRIQVTEYPTNQETRLASFANYCWAERNGKESALEKIDPTGGHHSVFDHGVIQAIDEDLRHKGYQQTSCAKANFIIDYRMGLHQDVAAVDASSEAEDSSMNPYGPRWSIGDDNSVTYEGLKKPRENIIVVRHGTIHIAAFSSANEILWHSSAEKTLNDQDTDETRKANLEKAIDEMMENFPTRK